MKAWEENIRKVIPYTPGDQPNEIDMVKLNTNENPYPPTDQVIKAMEAMDYEKMRLYPDPAAKSLVETLATYHGVNENQVFVGVGSDDVIAMAFQTFFNSKKPILFPDISYSFYSVWADLFQVPYERPALDANFQLVKEDYYKENGGIIFPNPNAPTSLYEDLSVVEEILNHNKDVIVIVDEAYIDFAGASALSLLGKYENLLVVRTFSKSRSMAGMRIGYAVGSPVLIKYLNDVKYSFNSYTMNLPSLVYGVESVKDEVYFRESIKKIIDTREKAKERLSKLGFTYPTPAGNFIFATHREWDAKKLYEALKEKHIYVRYFSSPRIDQYLRITIGTETEMEKLYKFLETYEEERGN